MKTSLPHCLLVVCLVSLLSACGGDAGVISTIGEDDASSDTATDAGTSTDSGPTQDTTPGDDCLQTTPEQAAQFARDYATALCQRAFQCGGNPELAPSFTFGGWKTVDDCVNTVYAGYIGPGQAEQAATQGSLLLDSCQSGPCLQGLAAMDCLEVHRALSQSPADFPVNACKTAYRGFVSAGSACTVGPQCEGESVCVRDSPSENCAGICADAGLATSQCGDIVCRADQYCNIEDDICFSRNAVGSPCAQDFECTLDAYCDGGVCTAVQTQVAAGEPCNFSTKLCGVGLFCADGVDIQCAEFKDVGEACRSFQCNGANYCDSQTDTCAPRKQAGASCVIPQECESLRCVNGTCTAADSLCP